MAKEEYLFGFKNDQACAYGRLQGEGDNRFVDSYAHKVTRKQARTMIKELRPVLGDRLCVFKLVPVDEYVYKSGRLVDINEEGV